MVINITLNMDRSNILRKDNLPRRKINVQLINAQRFQPESWSISIEDLKTKHLQDILEGK
uniref:DUF104 domain-containing protein n=1 Tax=Heterorhabditis bacteriophora TaxID=37862 RepID=A0A1I7W8H9_HETBA